MKMTEKLRQTLNKGAMTLTIAATVLSMKTTALAGSFTAYQGTDGNKIMEGVKNLFATIGTYGGGLYAIVAIFTLVLAIRNEDNEGRNKAILNLLAAIALLSMGVILNLFFK